MDYKPGTKLFYRDNNGTTLKFGTVLINDEDMGWLLIDNADAPVLYAFVEINQDDPTLPQQVRNEEAKRG